MDAERLGQELSLLSSAYPSIEYRVADGAHWGRIPVYPVPNGWAYLDDAVGEAEIAFQIPGQLGQAPYGFYVRPALTLAHGATPSSYTGAAATPWGGDFALFSWSVNDPWVPKTDIRAGANMLNFVRSFGDRLKDLS